MGDLQNLIMISVNRRNMKPKQSIRKTSILCAASAMLFSWSQVAVAAGPVAVAPGQSMEVVVPETSSPVKFSVSAGAGYLTGESKEIVYWPSFGNHKASELTWEIDSLFMVGIGAQLKVRNWLSVNFDGWFKAFDGEGTMDDYDWMVVGQDWSDWSHHEETDVTEGSIIDLNAEFAFFRTESVAFNAIVGYKRDEFGWEAYDGDFVYSSAGTARDITGSIPNEILGIGYEQTFTSLYFGMGLAANFTKFELAGRIIYSPLVNGEATDNHYLRNLVTYDEIDDGDMIAFDISGNYHINNHLSVLMAYSYQKYDTTQGDSEWHFQDEGLIILYPDGAGMAQTSSLFSISMQYTF